MSRNVMTRFLDAAHILPVLFSFTTPAKYCFRAMAVFANFVTGKNILPTSVSNLSVVNSPQMSSFPGADVQKVQTIDTMSPSSQPTASEAISGSQDPADTTTVPTLRRQSLRRALSSRLTRASSALRKRPASAGANLQTFEMPPPGSMPPLPRAASAGHTSTTSSDVGGPRFKASPPLQSPPGERTAGDPTIYADIQVGDIFVFK